MDLFLKVSIEKSRMTLKKKAMTKIRLAWINSLDFMNIIQY